MLSRMLGRDEGILKDLHAEHEEVAQLIDRLIASEDEKERGELFKEIRSNLVAHLDAEQMVLYRKLQKSENEETREFGFEGTNEHQLAEQQMDRMARGRTKMSEQWTAQAKVLQELVSHHVEEEEDKGFAAARREFDSETLDKLGEQFRRQKEKLMSKAD
jgi:hemerythrin-like domain-containing protein